MKVYKSEDAETIYEFIKKFEKETEEKARFVNALKRELYKGVIAQEKLRKITEGKLDESWDSIEK